MKLENVISRKEFEIRKKALSQTAITVGQKLDKNHSIFRRKLLTAVEGVRSSPNFFGLITLPDLLVGVGISCDGVAADLSPLTFFG